MTDLAAAHVQPSERILEGLLEAEELEDGEVDGRVKAEAALVRADGRVELEKTEVRSTIAERRQMGVGSRGSAGRAECFEVGQTDLDTIASVDLNLALVVLPKNTELDNALGDLDDGERTLVLGVLLEERLESRGNFVDGLLRTE